MECLLLLLLDRLQWVTAKRSAEGGSWRRMIVLAVFLSPSHLLKRLIRMRALTVERRPGWSADSIDILMILSGITGFCLSVSHPIDLWVLAVRSSARTVLLLFMVGRKEDED